MGVLDAIFGGKNGLVVALSKTFGGTATLRITTGTEKEAITGRVVPTFADYVVSFIPDAAAQNSARSAVPDGDGGALQSVAADIAGAFPASQVDAEPRAGRDVLRVDGLEYRLTTVEAVRVGDAVVQYRVTGARAV